MVAPIKAFQNEEEVVTIDKLTIENRLDRVSIYGSLDITKDKIGLEYALELKKQIDAIVEQLKKEDLPHRIKILDATEMENPFQ